MLAGAFGAVLVAGSHHFDQFREPIREGDTVNIVGGKFQAKLPSIMTGEVVELLNRRNGSYQVGIVLNDGTGRRIRTKCGNLVKKVAVDFNFDDSDSDCDAKEDPAQREAEEAAQRKAEAAQVANRREAAARKAQKEAQKAEREAARAAAQAEAAEEHVRELRWKTMLAPVKAAITNSKSDKAKGYEIACKLLKDSGVELGQLEDFCATAGIGPHDEAKLTEEYAKTANKVLKWVKVGTKFEERWVR